MIGVMEGTLPICMDILIMGMDLMAFSPHTRKSFIEERRRGTETIIKESVIIQDLDGLGNILYMKDIG